MTRIRFPFRSGALRPRSAVVLAMLVVGLLGGAPGAADARSSSRTVKVSLVRHHVIAHLGVFKRRHHRVKARASSLGPLQFGIYPGGAAGTVGPSGQTKPEVASLRLAALEQLRGTKPFAVHLYDSYTHSSDASSVPSWLADQIAQYTANGFEVELVLAYRPAASGGDVAGFVNFVRHRVDQLGPNSGVTSLQVTNEANVHGAPNAADGYYPGAADALVKGVIAAKDEAVRHSFTNLRVGFNWAYQTGSAETSFWKSLGKKGGRSFAAAVDWVGLDAYPGTWGPALAAGDLGSGARAATLDALSILRSTYLPLAALGTKPLHFSESGYPTGTGRTEQMQVTVMQAVVSAIVANQAKYNVSAYRWFDLRDADSANASFESQYGITRDDYSPKAGFAAYRDLVSAFG